MPVFKLPHDKLIKKGFENPIVAREFFEEYLPIDIQKMLDINSLKLEKESFVDQSLNNSSSDILFSAKFDKLDGYIFLLLEHQSKPDYWMAFRLHKYMLSIADKYLNEHPESKKLPLIYPLIFFNGKQKYNAPRNLWELFINPELAKKFWINDYQLINVNDIPDTELKKNLWAGTLQFFMKYAWERNALKAWQQIADLLPELAKVEIGYDHIRLLLTYSLTHIQEDDKIKLQNVLTKALGLQGEKVMASVAQKWYQDGKHEGKAEGKAEGIKIGEAKGGEKKAIAVARNLLKAKIAIDVITEATGLSKEQIQKLK